MRTSNAHRSGSLILNADDWGRDRETTDRTLECILRGTVSSVSAMMFMQDSERSAAIAREHDIDAGLHLNFTASFTARPSQARLSEHLERLARYLRRHRLAQVVFHPGLAGSFEYVVAAQREEFRRLYGAEPNRFDGHHHMHLCANVVFGKLLPFGTVVRRNFTFDPAEKGLWNRRYRAGIDRILARRHSIVDFFYSLAPPIPARVCRIVSLSRDAVVEMEAHPIMPEEYRFLAGGQLLRLSGDEFPVSSRFVLPSKRQSHGDAGLPRGASGRRLPSDAGLW